jgi:hypothetical protein
MPFVPVPNTAMFEMRYLWGGQHVENTLYFESSAAMNTTLQAAINTALVAWWTNDLGPNLTDQIELIEVFSTDLTTATSPVVSTPVTPSLPGGLTGDSAPNNCAFCVSFRTAGRGRSSRGRNYVPALDEGLIQQSILDTTYVSNLVTAYQALQGAGLFVAGAEWVVVSRFSGGAPRVTGLAQPVTAVIAVDAVVDSQRRRLPGRGL